MNKKVILIVLLIVLIVGFVIIYPVLFQEGNPLPIIKGIIKLSSSNSDIIKISDEPQIYITKTDKDKTPVIKLMDEEGWKFDEQGGSGYVFSKEDNILIVTRVQYTRKYMIWKVLNMN